MKSKLFIVIALIMLFCTSSYAESNSQQVTFTKTISTTSGMVMRPFSLDTPPEGTLEDSNLSINLNSTALIASLTIYKDGIIVEHNLVLLDNTDGTITYDLSSEGYGDYTMTIAFSDNLKYEASFSIE